ncbi:MAG: hypothetical protein LBF24_00015 [Puniceicoccales bacterium]|jgi:hypothetical protein|nr:hypothetical protein [Puniceicoccales bacterium]
MSRLSLFLLFTAAALALAPLAVLRGHVSEDCHRTGAVFLSPALAVLLLAFWAQIFPAFPKFRSVLALFAILLLYGLAPFDGCLRQEFLLRRRTWTAVRLVALSPLPWLLPMGRLLEGVGGAIILLFSAFHGIFSLLPHCRNRQRNHWKEDLFCFLGVLYPFALYLQSPAFLILALALQLYFLLPCRGSVLPRR